jgi:tetratricopeptide (TPR) repeat protein
VVLAVLFLLAASTPFDDAYRAGLMALQRNDLPAAQANLLSAARLAPDNGRVCIALAQVYWKSGDGVRAKDMAVKAAALGPEDPAVLEALATFYSETGDLVKAADAAGRYTEKIPAKTEARDRAVELYFNATEPMLKAQKFGEAVILLETARKRIGANAQIELALGVAYYGLRRFDEAADAFLRTIAIDPATAQPYIFLGRILDQIPGRQAEATERFAQYETAHPASPVGYLLHAQGLDAQAIEPEKARALLDKSLAIDGSNAAAHFEMGNLLDRLRRYEDATQEFERAAALNSSDAATHYRLARDYDRLGKHDAAQAERDKHAALVKTQDPLR